MDLPQLRHSLQYGPLTASLRFPKDRKNPLEPTLNKIAERLSEEAGEKLDTHTVTLLWVKAKGGVAVTSSANPENIKGLAKTAKVTVSLTPEEVAEIDNIGSQYHFRYYVSIFPQQLSLACPHSSSFPQNEHMTKDFPEPNLPKDHVIPGRNP